MSTGNKTILKQVLRDECLPALTARAAYFSMTDVRDWLRHRKIACPPALLREYLSEFMRKSVIHDAGRGWYCWITPTSDALPGWNWFDTSKRSF